MPLSLRLRYYYLAVSPPEDRNRRRQECWRERLRWVRQLRESFLKKRLDSGRVVVKSKKLHRMRGLASQAGQVESAEVLIN